MYINLSVLNKSLLIIFTLNMEKLFQHEQLLTGIVLNHFKCCIHIILKISNLPLYFNQPNHSSIQIYWIYQYQMIHKAYF